MLVDTAEAFQLLATHLVRKLWPVSDDIVNLSLARFKLFII